MSKWIVKSGRVMALLAGFAQLGCASAADASRAGAGPEAQPPTLASGDEATPSADPLIMEDLVSRVILYMTPVQGRADVSFCSLKPAITGNRNEAILSGDASAARGWAEWCIAERSRIVAWVGTDPTMVARVRLWIRQPVGDHNDFADGDMPCDTIRHHLNAHPRSRLFEGMADAYHRHLLAPPEQPPFARAWFYAGAPDNDAVASYPEPNFAAVSPDDMLARYNRDYVEPLNQGLTPLIAPGSIARIGIDKAVPHDERSGTFLIATTYPDELMYEPLGERGNPWISNPNWIGLILEDTFWERLGPGSRYAQPSEVESPIARVISRPMNFTPKEKWHRFCAMLQRRAYTASGVGGRHVSDEGDTQAYFPLVHLAYLQNSADGLLKGYNDWRESRGLGTVADNAFNTAEGVLRAVNEFDGPYAQQDERSGPSRRARFPAGRTEE